MNRIRFIDVGSMPSQKQLVQPRLCNQQQILSVELWNVVHFELAEGGATNTKFRSGAIVLDGLVPRVPGLMGSTPPRGYTTMYENSAGGSFIDCFHRVSWFQNDTDHLLLVKDALWDVSTTLRRLSKLRVSPGRQPEARGSLPMHVPAEAPQKSGLSALSGTPSQSRFTIETVQF